MHHGLDNINPCAGVARPPPVSPCTGPGGRPGSVVPLAAARSRPAGDARAKKNLLIIVQGPNDRAGS